MTRIPNRFHFVFGLKPQTEPFHLVHYLCLKSCIEVNHPERIDLYCHYEPYGEWWERIRPRLNVNRVDLEEAVRDHASYFNHDEGRLIKGWNLDYAHQSDFVRLRVLLEHGGVYADMDTLFVQPLPASLFEQEFVIGEEDLEWPGPDGLPVKSLCNAFLMARPSAAFGQRWLQRMAEVFDGTWSRHSCQEAAYVRTLMPHAVYVSPSRYHYKHACTREGIETLLRGLDRDLEDVYSVHLWAHLWWSPLRIDFSRFHNHLLTEEHIRTVDTTYNVAARRFLD